MRGIATINNAGCFFRYFCYFKHSSSRRGEFLVQLHTGVSQETSVVITFLLYENETCLWDAEIKAPLTEWEIY